MNRPFLPGVSVATLFQRAFEFSAADPNAATDLDRWDLPATDQLYGKVTKVTDGDTITVETQGRSTPVRLIGVDTPETVAPDQPIGCYGKEASDYTKKILADQIVRLEIPRIGDSDNAYGRTLAYVHLDTNSDGSYERLYNEDLIELGLARTTTFSHAHRREFERARQEAKADGAGLWGVCPGSP